jgi:hypothetical protein
MLLKVFSFYYPNIFIVFNRSTLKGFRMKKIFPLILASAFFASQVQAQSSTGRVKISGIRTGWNADQVAITFSGSVPNPAGCSTPDGIILNTSTPGFKTHYAAILTALATEKDVEIIIAPDGCNVNRPLFWGIYLY